MPHTRQWIHRHSGGALRIDQTQRPAHPVASGMPATGDPACYDPTGKGPDPAVEHIPTFSFGKDADKSERSVLEFGDGILNEIPTDLCIRITIEQHVASGHHIELMTCPVLCPSTPPVQ